MTRYMTTTTTTALLAWLISVTLAAAQGQSVGGPYRIAAGDSLDIIVWRNKELSMAVTVRPDGWISYPLAGEILVAGLTPVELQRQMEKQLSVSVQAPAVTVVVSRVAGFKISILGKVRTPGHYDATDATTVMDVLAMAGGPNEYAEPEQMYVLRRARPDAVGYVRIAVRYSAVLNPGTDHPNVAVRPGDIVIVP